MNSQSDNSCNKALLWMKLRAIQLSSREWEGFEHLNDVDRRQELCCKTVARQSFRLPTKEGCTVKSDTRSSIPNVRCEESQAKELPKIDQPKIVPPKESLSLRSESPRRKPAPLTYPQIKIVKNSCPLEDDGIMVYKSGLPTTSDRLLSHLKDVNFDQPVTREMHIRDLTFSSKFECGNLCCAYKITEFEYTLHMRADTNTLGHRQWYYFKVKNKKAGTIRFNVREFKKPLSLYSRGMKPYVLSRKQHQQEQCPWRQAGENVRYRKTEMEGCRSWYLTFDYTFRHDNDEVYFAACPPYSYSFLIKELDQLTKNGVRKCQMSQEILCKSLGGLEIPVVTVAHPNKEDGCLQNFVVVIARTHPGQSVSSWVMNGILKYFAREQLWESQYSRSLVLKIVPMVNVDGVFLGNYRTGVIGKDFNRNFANGRSALFPEIEAVRNLVRQLKKSGRVSCFIDLHGHSIQKNSFVFGPQSTDLSSSMCRLSEELARVSRYFKASSCRFSNNFSGNLRQTARVYFQQKENVLAFTIENSLGLYYQASDKHTYPMETTDWESFGRDIAQSIMKLNASEENSAELSYFNKTKPLNLYRPAGKTPAMPVVSNQKRSSCMVSKLDDESGHSFFVNTHNSTVRAGTKPSTEETHITAQLNRRFKSTERPRNSKPDVTEGSPVNRPYNIRQILKQTQQKESRKEVIGSISTLQLLSMSNKQNKQGTDERNRHNTSVEETIREDVEVRLRTILAKRDRCLTEAKTNLEKLSQKNDSDDNDSDSEGEDLPESQWNALAKEVLETINASEHPLTESKKKIEATVQQKAVQVLRVNLPAKKKQDMLPPHAFREMRFTLSKFHPKKKPVRLETLEKLAEVPSGEASRIDKPRTEPSLALAEKYLSEQISVFSGGKIIQLAYPTIGQSYRRNTLNEKQLLERIRRNLGEASPLSKYFKRKL